jgi:hypothetical protein
MGAFLFVRVLGIGPRTSVLSGQRSTTELYTLLACQQLHNYIKFLETFNLYLAIWRPGRHMILFFIPGISHFPSL